MNLPGSSQGETATPAALQTRHVYEHDVDRFERRVNDALREITSQGSTIADIQYASDSATVDNPRGGFGCLIVFAPE